MKFEQPSFEVIQFDSQDVIATSGTLTTLIGATETTPLGSTDANNLLN